MIRFKPRSWSAQARTFADSMYESGLWMVEHGEWTDEQRKCALIVNLQSSYRHPRIVYRAAKRLHRKER